MTPPQPSPIPTVEAEPVANARFVRKRESQTADSEGTASRIHIAILAVIGLLALIIRRVDYDPWSIITAELCIGATLVGLILAAAKLQASSAIAARLVVPALGAALVSMPWLVNILSRRFGNGNDPEILLLTSLAWGSIALAVSPKARTQNLSVACSGFLTLFTVFTSDSPEITPVVYAWIALCLWWLVSRHWAGISTLQAANVQSSLAARGLTIAIGCGAFILAIFLISDSVPILRKLNAEIAPTSGGTTQKDKSARSGVGNGDALIAAKNHATSFGPVETDFFLDSPKPSLFDVFSDEFGEPIRKKKVERAQALSPNDIRTAEGEFSEANRSSGGDFSVEREAPELREPLEDLRSDALMFFEGRTGIRLAVNRFENFEEDRWLTSKVLDRPTLQNLQPMAVDIEEDLWFAPPGIRIQSSLSPFASSFPEALRFTRYGDNSIPVALGMQLWRIDQLTRTDFFAYTGDGCLLMPGRETVPDYTVVRLVNSQLDAAKLHQHMRTCAPGRPHLKVASGCESRIAQLAHMYADDYDRGLDQVNAVIAGLRRDFSTEQPATTIERADDGAINRFLDQRQGPSYLFATTAALMLDHLGYQTRFVTGFYVNPKHYVRSENATAILPQDAHCWIEVNSGHGYWVPFEPTPGFRSPPIRSTWAFWASRHWRTAAGGLAVAVTALAILWVLRGILFNAGLFIAAPLIRLLPERKRLASFRALLDARWRLIGAERTGGMTPRKQLADRAWGLSETQQTTLMQFFDMYDKQRFGTNAHSITQLPVLAAMPGIIRSIKKIKPSSP